MYNFTSFVRFMQVFIWNCVILVTTASFLLSHFYLFSAVVSSSNLYWFSPSLSLLVPMQWHITVCQTVNTIILGTKKYRMNWQLLYRKRKCWKGELYLFTLRQSCYSLVVDGLVCLLCLGFWEAGCREEGEKVGRTFLNNTKCTVGRERLICQS